MRAILTYHSIDTSGSPISVHPEAFARHVAWLASGAVQVTTIGGLLALASDTDAVALTFDDGYTNVYTEAIAPLLAHGLTATLFVVTDCVGRTNRWRGRPAPDIPTLPLLDWATLARLAEHGVQIGAHSRTHPDLTALDSGRLEDEVAGASDVVAREVGRRPDAFAYPYGRADEKATAMVRRHYRWGCGAALDWLGPDVDCACLPRLDAYYLQAPGRLEQFGTAAFRRYVRVRGLLREARRRVAARR